MLTPLFSGTPSLPAEWVQRSWKAKTGRLGGNTSVFRGTGWQDAGRPFTWPCPPPHRAPRQQWAEAGFTVRYLLALITQVGGHGLPTRAGEALRERTRKPEP